MTQSRISYNINGARAGDISALRQHLAAINPTAVLFMDALELARETAVILQNTIVIHRDFAQYNGDDDLVKKISAEMWVDSQLKLGAPNVWRYCGNEQGYSPDVITWLVKVIRYNATKPNPLKLVIGNFSAGTPGQPGHPIEDDWKLAHDLLMLCDQYRAWLIVGCHEYNAGVITDGLYGGYADNAGVQPGQPGGKNLVPSSAWPMSIDGINTFHMGRFRFLLNYCKSAGIKPPRIIITEWGFDSMGDVKPWLNTLQKTGGYDEIIGWRSLAAQWGAWYGKTPGWDAETAYFQQLRWADRVIYRPSGVVEGQLIFTWSQSPDWVKKGFDVSTAGTFQGLLEQSVKDTGPIPLPVPPPVPAPPPAPIPPSTPAEKPAPYLLSVEVQLLPSDADILKKSGVRLERILAPVPAVTTTSTQTMTPIETMITGG
jgi:hypothetical protein